MDKKSFKFDKERLNIRQAGITSAAEYSFTETENSVIISCGGALNDKLEITAKDGGFFARRTIKNVTDKTLYLKELAVEIKGIISGGKAEADYYYSVENPRLFETFTLPVDFDRIKGETPDKRFKTAPVEYADPCSVTERISSSPYQPFPAVLLSNYESDKGVVLGSLSQKVFYHSFTFKHEDGGVTATVYSSFKDIGGRKVLAGEELEDEWYMGETDCASDITKVFNGYTRALRGVLLKRKGVSDANRYSLIWDSWNDGIYRDVSEEMLVKEAAAIKALFPNVTWFQLDDGYSRYCEKDVDLDAHGIGVAYEGKDGVDTEKFPEGLKGYTEKIKKIGLRPALWVGGFCPVKTRIYKEHPEWFLDYGYRLDFSAPLDVSKKEVRDYMVYAMKQLIKENGFEGIKHDFWSYAFEDGRALLSCEDNSGYEYREWWGKELRKIIPEDGYIESGCDLSMGNPFLREIFDNYRFGLDVGAGKWENVLTTMFWGTACISSQTGDLYVPNCDSVGYLPGLNDADFMFFINFAKISSSMAEISGRFAEENRNPERLKILKKATCCINNGQKVYLPDFDYRRKGKIYPEVMYLNSAHFSRDENNSFIPLKTVALFNAGEEEKRISFTFKDLGLKGEKYVIADIWEESAEEKAIGYEYVLKPHGSKLLSVCEKDAAIIDSNVMLSDVIKSSDEIKCTLHYAAEVRLMIDGEVQGVTLSGAPVSFSQKGGKLCFVAEKPAELNIKIKV